MKNVMGARAFAVFVAASVPVAADWTVYVDVVSSFSPHHSGSEWATGYATGMRVEAVLNNHLGHGRVTLHVDESTLNGRWDEGADDTAAFRPVLMITGVRSGPGTGGSLGVVQPHRFDVTRGRSRIAEASTYYSGDPRLVGGFGCVRGCADFNRGARLGELREYLILYALDDGEGYREAWVFAVEPFNEGADSRYIGDPCGWTRGGLYWPDWPAVIQDRLESGQNVSLRLAFPGGHVGGGGGPFVKIAHFEFGARELRGVFGALRHQAERFVEGCRGCYF